MYSLIDAINIGHRWIPLTKASDAELSYFFVCAWTNGLASNRDAGDFRRHRVHYDVTVMCSYNSSIRRKESKAQSEFMWGFIKAIMQQIP